MRGFVGKLMYDGYYQTGDPLHHLHDFNAFTEIEVVREGKNLWPQTDWALLAAIRAHYPGAKFILSHRDPVKHASSMRRWSNLGKSRLPGNAVPGLPEGFGRSPGRARTLDRGPCRLLPPGLRRRRRLHGLRRRGRRRAATGSPGSSASSCPGGARPTQTKTTRRARPPDAHYPAYRPAPLRRRGAADPARRQARQARRDGHALQPGARPQEPHPALHGGVRPRPCRPAAPCPRLCPCRRRRSGCSAPSPATSRASSKRRSPRPTCSPPRSSPPCPTAPSSNG